MYYFNNHKSFEIVMQFKTPTINQKKTKVTKFPSTCPPNKVYDQHLKTCVTGNVSNPLQSKQVSPEILDASFGWSNETSDKAPI